MRSPTAQRPRRGGFTLTELVVAIVILGLLAGIAVVSYSRVTENSKVAADEQTLGAVARAAAAQVAMDQSVIDTDALVAAIDDCGGCELEAWGGAETQAAAGDPWVVVGHDYGDGPATDPAEPASVRAGTYGYLLGDGWGSDTVNLVMASRVAGRYVHAQIRGYGEVETWSDDSATPDAPGEAGGELEVTAAGGDAEITVSWDGEGASFDVNCESAIDGVAGASEAGVTGLEATISPVENFVTYTCTVTSDTNASGSATATPTTDLDELDDGEEPNGGDAWAPEDDSSNPSAPPRSIAEPAYLPPAPGPAEDGIGHRLWSIASFPSPHESPPHKVYVTARATGALYQVTDTGGAASAGVLAPAGTFAEPMGIIAGPAPHKSVPYAGMAYTTLYVADFGGDAIYRFDPNTRSKTLVANVDAPTDLAGFACFDGGGNRVSGTCLYVTGSAGITRINLQSGATSLVAASPSDAVALIPTSVTGTALWASTPGSIESRSVTGAVGSSVALTDARGGEQRGSEIFMAAGDSVVAVDGAGTIRSIRGGLVEPSDVHYHGNSPYRYVVESGTDCVWRINANDGSGNAIWCGSTGVIGPLAMDFPGDDNGFIARHLLANGENPALDGTMAVSSNLSGAEALIDRQVTTSVSFDPGHFVTFDLGPSRQLSVSGYTLYSHNSGNYPNYLRPTHFTLSGANSPDGPWTPIDIRTGDTTLQNLNTWYRYDASGPGANEPYRFVRFEVTGAGRMGGAWDTRIAELELYGHLHPIQTAAANLPFETYGDDGLLAWAGGEHSNPIGSGMVAHMSGGGSTLNPANLTDGTAAGTTAVNGSRMVMDFGPARRVRVDTYTMLTNAGGNYPGYYLPRNWVLEGKNDPSDAWTVIDSRSGDLTARAPGRWYRYNSYGPGAGSSFRMIQLRITGSGSTWAETKISELELYGNMTVLNRPANAPFRGFGATSGLFAHAGGAHQGSYTNPVTNGTIALTGTQADRANASDRNEGTFAGLVNGQWMTWDLGERPMRIDSYSLRGRDNYTNCAQNNLTENRYCPRNWTLQVSNNGSDWTTLDDRTNGVNVLLTYLWVHYYPENPSSEEWRYIRLTGGPGGHNNAPNTFAEIEFHGNRP